MWTLALTIFGVTEFLKSSKFLTWGYILQKFGLLPEDLESAWTAWPAAVGPGRLCHLSVPQFPHK